MFKRLRLTIGLGLLVATVSGNWATATPALPEIHFAYPESVRVSAFTSTFGMRKPSGRRHEGNDLMAPKMSPVYAAADGVVTLVDHGRSAGNYVIIEHGGGWSTWYLHLNNDTPGTDDGTVGPQQALVDGVTEGSFVSAGQQIGYVGDSGNAEWTMPHTHFEVHFQGHPVDPYDFLVEARDRALIVADLELEEAVPSLG